MRVFRATHGFRLGNMPDNFRTQKPTGIDYGFPGIPRDLPPIIIDVIISEAKIIVTPESNRKK